MIWWMALSVFYGWICSRDTYYVSGEAQSVARRVWYFALAVFCAVEAGLA